MQKTILVVDDERAITDTLREILHHAGYKALGAYSGESALAMLESTSIDLLVSDVVMPGMTGVELAVHTSAKVPQVRILLISGNATFRQVVGALGGQGVEFEFLAKPVFPQEMLQHIERLLVPPDGGGEIEMGQAF